MNDNKTQIVYRLAGVDADDGVDIFEIAPVLMKFGELIKSANTVLGYDYQIEVKVRPFREGSWIADFVIHQNLVENLLNHLKTTNGADMMLLLSFLGLNVKEGITGVAEIVRRTKGAVSNFQKNSDETVTYTQPDGDTFTVTMPEHRLVQSPLIQVNYYSSVVSPLEKFPTAQAVEIKIDGQSSGQEFVDSDVEAFETYAKLELLEDVEDNTSVMSGVYLKPKRGSYSGEEKAYSFIMGENNTLWPVTIEDQNFIDSLKTGEIRPYSEDILKVNLEVRQRKDAANRMTSQYIIKEVVEYIKYEKPRQLRMDE